MVSFQKRLNVVLTLSLFASVATLAGCSSARLKERKSERERVAAASGMYCEFISAEEHQDFEVELNLQMARKCDAEKAFTVTSFRTPSDNQGLVYCCTLRRLEEKPERSSRASEKPVEKIEAPKVVETPKVEAPAKKAAKAAPPVVAPPVIVTPPAAEEKTTPPTTK